MLETMNVMNRLVAQDYRIMMMHTMLMNVMILNPNDFDVVILERVSTFFPRFWFCSVICDAQPRKTKEKKQNVQELKSPPAQNA